VASDYAHFRAELVIQMLLKGELPVDPGEFDKIAQEAWGQYRSQDPPPKGHQHALQAAERHGVPPSLAMALAEHMGGFDDPDHAEATMRAMASAKGRNPDLADDHGKWAAEALGQGPDTADTINAHTQAFKDNIPESEPEQQDPKVQAIQEMHKQYRGEEVPEQLLGELMGLDPQQVEERIRSLDSHIPGMTAGQFQDLKQMADKESRRQFGHLTTSAIVQQLFQSNTDNPRGLKQFFENIAPDGVDPGLYQAIAKAAQPVTQAIWNEAGLDPREIMEIYLLGVSQGFQMEDEQEVTAPLASDRPAPKAGV